MTRAARKSPVLVVSGGNLVAGMLSCSNRITFNTILIIGSTTVSYFDNAVIFFVGVEGFTACRILLSDEKVRRPPCPG